MKDSQNGTPSRAARIRVLLAVIWLALVAAPVSAEEGHKNNGQDPTNPITRFDIRFQNDLTAFDAYHNQGDNDNQAGTLILRTDAPIPLGKNAGTLALRFDFPMTSQTSATAGESGTFTFGSAFASFLHIVPKQWGPKMEGFAWAWGLATQLPTATNGRRKTTFVPMAGASIPIYPFGKKHRGSAFIPVFKYFRGPEESLRGGTLNFDKINEFHFLPTINFTFPWKGINFLTLWGNYEWQLTFEDGVVNPAQESGDYFIPYDVTLGWLLSGGKAVLSVTFAGPLVYSDGYQQYDARFMLRVGYFFGN